MLQEHTFNVHTTNKIILLQNEYKEWEFSNFHGIRGDSDLFVFAAPVCVCVCPIKAHTKWRKDKQDRI